MTVSTEKQAKLIQAWPKYRLVCGEVFRLLTEKDAPERLIGLQWRPD